MQIINTSAVNEIVVPCRPFTTGDFLIMNVYNEDTKESIITTPIPAAFSNGQLTLFSHDFAATENIYYYVIITFNNEELVKFKMFCTNETDFQNFKITEGDFVNAPDSPDKIHTVE